MPEQSTPSELPHPRPEPADPLRQLTLIFQLMDSCAWDADLWDAIAARFAHLGWRFRRTLG